MKQSRKDFEKAMDCPPGHLVKDERNNYCFPLIHAKYVGWQLAQKWAAQEAAQGVVSGFYEEEYPHYTDGPPTHELQSLVTAEEINGLVSKIRDHKASLSHTPDFHMDAASV